MFGDLPLFSLLSDTVAQCLEVQTNRTFCAQAADPT